LNYPDPRFVPEFYSRCIRDLLSRFFKFQARIIRFISALFPPRYLRFITSPGENVQDAGQAFVTKIVSRRASFLFCYRSKRGSFILPFISRRSRRLETPTISRPLSNFRMIFRCLRSPPDSSLYLCHIDQSLSSLSFTFLASSLPLRNRLRTALTLLGDISRVSRDVSQRFNSCRSPPSPVSISYLFLVRIFRSILRKRLPAITWNGFSLFPFPWCFQRISGRLK